MSVYATRTGRSSRARAKVLAFYDLDGTLASLNLPPATLPGRASGPPAAQHEAVRGLQGRLARPAVGTRRGVLRPRADAPSVSARDRNAGGQSRGGNRAGAGHRVS